MPVPSLRELLERHGLVDAGALAHALAAQRASGRTIDAELVARGAVDPRHVATALQLQHCIAAAANDAVAPAPDGIPAAAVPVAAMQVHDQARTLAIAAADVARGVVDVRAGTRYSVATTGEGGYLIDFVPRAALFLAVEITLGTLRARLPADGGTVVARGRPRRDLHAELSYRFRLAQGVAPGVYPFPLDLAVRPL